MRALHLLNLGNARKVKENLSSILDQQALDAIETEIASNSPALLNLAQCHFRFAVNLPARHWRQRVSRLYYAAYNACRALRLFVFGEYATDVKDHQRLEKLPEDFPKSVYVYKNAKLESAAKVPNGHSITLLSKDGAKKIIKAYRNKMSEKGWKEMSSMDMNKTTMLTYKKNKKFASISIMKEKKKTRITITVMKQ